MDKDTIKGLICVIGALVGLFFAANFIYMVCTRGDGKADVISTEEIGHLHRATFDGHVYIIRKKGYCGGMVHDPDCPCGKH